MLKNIEIPCFEIKTQQGILCLCPCHDAELFSCDALRALLLSDNGSKIFASAAVSRSKDSIGIKLIRL